MALAKGTPTAPAWITVLDTCEAWGVVPWTLTTYPKPIIWWIRNQVYYRIKAQVAKKQAREMEK